MKYEYINATGKIEIEVDEQFYDILLALDREEFNSDRKHARRHPLSLEEMEYEGDWLSDGADILSDLIKSEDSERLHKALASLTSSQQALLERVYAKNEKIVDIARKMGVSQPAISQRLLTIIKILKRIL